MSDDIKVAILAVAEILSDLDYIDKIFVLSQCLDNYASDMKFSKGDETK